MVKKRPVAPRFCSMYGDVLSYPVDDTGVTRVTEFARGGARVHRAPRRDGQTYWKRELWLTANRRSKWARSDDRIASISFSLGVHSGRSAD